MKKKTVSKPALVKKKRKIKWSDVYITTIAFVVIIGFFVWFVVHNYQLEKIKQELKEAYKASLPAPGVSLPQNSICMVNNMYMHKPQIPVLVDGKTYYACCNKCVRDLNVEENTHFAVDPISKKKVDKATAFVTMKPDLSGVVFYFESEENAKTFFKK